MSFNTTHKPKNLVGKLMVGVTGVKTAFKTEPTLVIQVITGTIAAILALFMRGQWAYVKQTIFLTVAVVLAELFNTAVEYLCDLVEPNKNSKIKKVKDVLAGAVLIVTLMAIVITLVDLLNILKQ